MSMLMDQPAGTPSVKGTPAGGPAAASTGAARSDRTQRLRIELVDDLAALESLRDAWDALAAECDASPYACFDWFMAGVRYLGNGAAVKAVVVRDDAGLLAILPLERGTERVSRLSQPVLRFAGRWVPASLALISPRAHAQTLVAAVFERLRAAAGWRYCRLVRQPAESPLVRGAPPSGEDGALRRVCVPLGRSVVIDVPSTWDAYRATLSPAHRKNLARRTNGLARRGALRLERTNPRTPPTHAYVDALLEDALTVSRRSWQATASEGRSICDAEVLTFVRDVSHRLAARGRLDLSVLYCGDRPVSFIWGAARWPRSSIEKMGFDAEFAELSPGMVHMGQLIADSVRHEITSIDFGHEFAEHKCRWGRPGTTLHDVLYYPPTLLARLICWWRHDRRKPRAAALAVAPVAAECVFGII